MGGPGSGRRPGITRKLRSFVPDPCPPTFLETLQWAVADLEKRRVVLADLITKLQAIIRMEMQWKARREGKI